MPRQPGQVSVADPENAAWLQDNQITTGPRHGAWSYPGGNGDNSNSQFALLALYEAQRVFTAAHTDIRVEDRTWRLAKAYWEDCQNLDGSWGYYKPVPGTGSMTCAGITSLIIAGDMVHRADAKAEGDHVQCCAQGDVENDRIERAMDWLGRNFSVSTNPGDSNDLWWLYYLYGVERAGRLTARRFIGGHDWYREGADYLVSQHGHMAAGYWKGRNHAEEEERIGTSFALLFLCKGRRPVLMAKLRHGDGLDWNQHRNDVANLTAYVESKWRFDMTWQVIELDRASVDNLLQVPVRLSLRQSEPVAQRPRRAPAAGPEAPRLPRPQRLPLRRRLLWRRRLRPRLPPTDGGRVRQRPGVSAQAPGRVPSHLACRRERAPAATARCWGSNSVAAPA